MGSEPDMRQEFINTLDGSFPEEAKAQSGLIRAMRRDSDGALIPCGCVDNITNEPDKDRFCPICFGEGNMWDETEITLYRTLEDSDVDNATRHTLKEPGLINVPLVVFYIRYSTSITEDDKVIELVLGEDGTPEEPQQRRSVYRVNTAWDYRSDGGRLEYWKVFSYLEKVKYLNAPTYGDL